jgi:hypothetical protein
VEWDEAEQNKYFIPLFGYFKNEGTKLKVSSGEQILSCVSSTGGSKFCIMTIDLFFN